MREKRWKGTKQTEKKLEQNETHNNKNEREIGAN